MLYRARTLDSVLCHHASCKAGGRAIYMGSPVTAFKHAFIAALLCNNAVIIELAGHLSTRLLVLPLNLSGDKRKRDLGGLLLLMIFMIVRRSWWQLAPLLEELVAEHPIFTLGFMQEIRISGLWDRWVRVTKQYHQERKGMLKAAEGPVFSIAGLLPPHLIVARLLEPVHVSQWTHVIQLLLLLPSCCNMWFFCSSTHTQSFWAAQYNTWLLIKLMPKGVVFSFLFDSKLLLGAASYGHGASVHKAVLADHWCNL